MRKYILSMVAFFICFSVSAATEISGYFDGGFRTYSQKQAAPSAKTVEIQNMSGWMIHSGAVNLNHSADESTSLVLNFNYSGDTTGTTSNNIVLGGTNSQVYLVHKYSKKYSIKIGQFASIFGFESNSSNERFFSSAGMSNVMVAGATHTGLLVNYTRGAVSFDLLMANSGHVQNYAGKNSATNDAGRADDGSQNGVRLAWMKEGYRASVGYLANPVANHLDQRATMKMYEVMLGASLGRFMADIQYNKTTDPSINTTGAGNTKKETAANTMLHLMYRYSKDLGFGIRYETVADNSSNTGLSSYQNGLTEFSGTATALGANYKESSSLEYRVSYHLISSKISQAAAESTDTNFFAISGLYNF